MLSCTIVWNQHAVQCNAALPLCHDRKRIDLDFRYTVGEFRNEPRQGTHRLCNCLNVSGRLTTKSAEKPRDLCRCNRFGRRFLVDRCHADSDILVEFDLDSSSAYDNQRAKIRIHSCANKNLRKRRYLSLNEKAKKMIRKTCCR